MSKIINPAFEGMTNQFFDGLRPVVTQNNLRPFAILCLEPDGNTSLLGHTLPPWDLVAKLRAIADKIEANATRRDTGGIHVTLPNSNGAIK